MDAELDKDAVDAVAAEQGWRRAHPLAAAVYGALRDRGREDKVLVLRALEQRAGPRTTTDKQERAYNALAEFVEDEGRFPTSKEWDQWRAQTVAAGMRANLPSSMFVRDAFGSWPAARAAFDAASAPMPDVLSRRLTALGPSLGDESLLEIVRVWAGMQRGPLVCADFRRWLAHPRATTVAGIAKAPRTYTPFKRFGGWNDVLMKAGFDPQVRGTLRRGRLAAPSGEDLLWALGEWAASRQDTLFRDDFKIWWQSASFPDRPDLDGVSRQWRHIRDMFGTWPAFLATAGLSHRGPAAVRSMEQAEAAPEYKTPYATRDSPEEWLGWLRAAATELGSSMSMTEYDRWRRRRMDDAARTGEPIPTIPHWNCVQRHFHGWPAAKRAAGLITDEQAAFERTRRTYTRTDLINAVADAMASYGTTIRAIDFKDWRTRLMAGHRDDPGFKLPETQVVRKQLGGPSKRWPVVVHTVLAERPELGHGAGEDGAAYAQRVQPEEEEGARDGAR